MIPTIFDPHDDRDSVERLVVYGTGKFGRYMALELASSYVYPPICIAADSQYVYSKKIQISSRVFDYYCIDEITKYCPPNHYHMLVVFGGRSINERIEAFCKADSLGYRFVNYCHPSSVVNINWSDVVGRNIIVYENCTIDDEAFFYDNVMVRPNCYIGHNSTIGSHTFLSPGCHLAGYSSVGERCFIGMGANIAGGSVAPCTLIGAGSLVLKHCGPNAKYFGVPAKIQGYLKDSIQT